MRKPAAPRTDAAPIPGDVRLMHVTANLLFVVAGVLLAALLVNGLSRLPAFALRAIRIEGDMVRNSAATL
ncbi:MAG TPA: cell division protein FtsQ, partial [Albitalea sp.]